MKLFKTVRGKLTLYFVLVFGVMLCIFSTFLYNIFAKQNRDDIDKAMIVLAGSINDEIQSDNFQPDILKELNETFIPFSNPKQQYVEITDDSGKIILKSLQLKELELPVQKEFLLKSLKGNQIFKTSEEEISDNYWGSYGIRLLLYPVSYKSNKYMIVIGIPLSNLEDTLFKFRLILYISIPFTLLLSSVLGWIFSKRAYAPVNEIINNSNSITVNNLDKRLPVNKSGDEISQLALTLNNMMERLQKSFLVLKQFTSDASHELKTPLTILKGEIEVALNKERTIDEYKKILTDNLDEVERLQKITDGLLTLSQFESGNLRVLTEKINLEELLTEAVFKINNLAKKKNIRIILKLDESQNDTSGNSVVIGDRSKLLNVFLNLFDNAIKYSHLNGEIICSENIIASENKILVSIKDNGFGISPENLENIFNRFYRSEFSRTRDEHNSTGLGLAIAKAVIEAHNGKISVNSSLGKGTTFLITFNIASK